MKVLLLNGSPHEKGCTYTALCEVASELQKGDVETEILWIGNKPVQGCIGCHTCRDGRGKCVFNDFVNEFFEKADKADGFVFGSPVFYGSANGAFSALLDRMFYAGGKYFAHKPAASVVSARRSGTTTTYDQLNKYIGLSNMLMVPSQYWNMVHGNSPEEVRQDIEGLQIMRTVGKNMVWLLRLIACGKENGLPAPQLEAWTPTNFIH